MNKIFRRYVFISKILTNLLQKIAVFFFFDATLNLCISGYTFKSKKKYSIKLSNQRDISKPKLTILKIPPEAMATIANFGKMSDIPSVRIKGSFPDVILHNIRDILTKFQFASIFYLRGSDIFFEIKHSTTLFLLFQQACSNCYRILGRTEIRKGIGTKCVKAYWTCDKLLKDAAKGNLNNFL